MSNFKILILPFLLFWVNFLSGCSESNHANGTGSVAGETEIAITVVQGETPVTNAQVSLWVIQGDTLQQDTLINSSVNGMVRISKNSYQMEGKEGKILVVAKVSDSLSAMEWITSEVDSCIISMENSESLKGILEKNSQVVQGTRIKVLDKETYTDVEGFFEVENLPPGTHYVSVFDENKIQTFAGDANSKETLIEIQEESSILVENFENWSYQTLIGKLWGGGWWYASTDETLGGNSFITPDFNNENPITDSTGYNSSNSLHVKYSVDTTFTGHFALVGFNLGEGALENPQEAYYNLSELEAISFEIKGSGSIYLQLVYSNNPSDSSSVEYENIALTLNPEWTHYRISTESVSEALNSISAINFMAETDGELFLDNIRLEGISLGEWSNLGL